MAGLDAIAAGADFVLVAGVEVQTTVSARDGGDACTRISLLSSSIDDFTFPALFGRRAKAYCDIWCNLEIDTVPIKAYNNANRNPLAHMKAAKWMLKMRFFLVFWNNGIQKLRQSIGLLSSIDGASAMLLVSETGLEMLGKNVADVAEIIGRGHSVASLYEDGDPTALHTSADAVSKAYAQAVCQPAIFMWLKFTIVSL